MTAQQLKNSILQMAVQGKLVPQDKNDEPASVLLERIKAEKQALIKAGKIKKEKPLAPITEEEIPFDIPESWEWVRLGSVINAVSARRVHQSDWKNSGIPFYRAREIAKLAENGYVENELFISEELYDEYSQSGVPQCGDLMITAVGTLGKAYIVKDTDRFYYKDASVICLENFGKICSEYLKYLMMSPYMEMAIKENSSGTTVGTITLVRANEYMIPVPPLEEQKRIVAKIEELLPYIEKYDKAETKLSTLNTTFPEALKKSILQEAVQGKLVPQDPNDEPASVLLERIRAEKQALVKAGKLKKDKPLSPITEDEIPFEIPESWIWVRLSDVIDVRDGTHDTPGYIPEGYPLITGKDFYNGYFDFAKTKYISKGDYEEIIKRSKVDVDDILFSMIGGNIGSMIVITEENYIDMAIKNVALFKQYNYELSLTGYLEVFLRSQVPNMQAIAKGGAQSFVSLNILRNYPFPLPPMEEQKRIVSRIKEILSICERLV